MNMKPTVYIRLAKDDVVKYAVEELGWTHDTMHPRDCHIYWLEKCPSVEEMNAKVKEAKVRQKYSRFVGMHETASKHQFSRLMNRMIQYFPSDYHFYPRTFLIPEDQILAEQCAQELTEKTTYIVKPSYGAQGTGIYLCQDLRRALQIAQNQLSIIQHYIPNPLLIEGYKFDLRIYVLVCSIDPLRIYVYNDGLVRICTERYVPPSSENLSKFYMHLTNYSLNKYSEKFEANTDENDPSQGNKRSIEWLNEYLSQCPDTKYKFTNMWDKIDDMIIKTIIAMKGPLIVDYKSSFERTNSEKYSDNSFHILGFDVLLDDNLDPWLIEVNNHPSMQTDSPLDFKIKKGVLQETFAIVGYDFLSTKQTREEYNSRMLKGMRLITTNQTSEQYRHLDLFANEKLVQLFSTSCGFRCKYQMPSTKFVKFCREHEIVLEKSTSPFLVSAQADLLFIAVTRHKSGTLNYEQFLDCLIYISKKMFGEGRDEEEEGDKQRRKKSSSGKKEDIYTSIISETNLPAFLEMLRFLRVLE